MEKKTVVAFAVGTLFGKTAFKLVGRGLNKVVFDPIVAKHEDTIVEKGHSLGVAVADTLTKCADRITYGKEYERYAKSSRYGRKSR